MIVDAQPNQTVQIIQEYLIKFKSFAFIDSTTQKSLYPTLFPQVPTTTPQPYFAKGNFNGIVFLKWFIKNVISLGQHYPSAPQSNYFNRNSTFQYPINNFGSNDSAYGWNSNFNPHTTSPSYQPYGQYSKIKFVFHLGKLKIINHLQFQQL